MRSALAGSFTALHSLSKIIVVRSTAEYCFHCGSPPWFGLPLRANAIQAFCTFSLNANRVGELPVIPMATSTVPNTNGMHSVCGVLRLPSPACAT